MAPQGLKLLMRLLSIQSSTGCPDCMMILSIIVLLKLGVGVVK